MCLAIYKPANIKIDETALETGFSNNDDGAGFTVREKNGTLRTFKGFFKFKQFLEYWRNYAELEAMIHFRWATSGLKNKDNCHPFRFGQNKSWSMIHNGILSSRTTNAMSDTACFAVDVLHELAIRDMLRYTDVIEQIEEEIGGGNKMVVMPPTGDAIILNADKGFWQDNVWWSNSSFEKTTFRYGAYNTSSAQNWWDSDEDEFTEWNDIRSKNATKPAASNLHNDEEKAYLDFLEEKWRAGLNGQTIN